ncbi:hypothetical protein GCM10009119_19590 [Algoriphagus jejuensis]|uniref:HNH nuclease domain-containing protein n=1 Tax=Algoriphagus jejuensis TaxID=419934 RepID=A0ABP3YEB2_9BACT
MPVDVNDFERQMDCIYQGERYSVRDNGAVYRHTRENRLLRRLDNEWTFGKANNNGYLLMASEVVHRIVADAFLGEPPSPEQNVVDHLDTNRRNNRPENLRWVSKLDNKLSNPITRKKIVFYCGSMEAFIANPAILKEYLDKDPKFGWMRTVTPEEAKTSWQRLSNWARKSEPKASSKSNTLGEWVFGKSQESIPNHSEAVVASLTPNVIQANWKTPSVFPLCPQAEGHIPIEKYAVNLKIGEVFSRNRYTDSIVEAYAVSRDKDILWVLGKSSNSRAVKPWSLAEVIFENGKYVHRNMGSFFKKDGAEKEFTLAQGLEWAGGDTFDDNT